MFNDRRSLGLLLSSLLLCTLGVAAQSQPADVQVVERMPRGKVPQLVYLFFTPGLLAGDHYLETIDAIAKPSTFSMVFLTQRDGADFYDTSTMKPVFTRLVERAESRGLQVGLQFYDDEKGVAPDNFQAVTEDREVRLDEAGRAAVTAKAQHLRLPSKEESTSVFAPDHSDVLGVWLFRKTADGEYEPGTLVHAGAELYTIGNMGTDSVQCQLHAGNRYAGYTAFIISAHFFKHADLFSDALVENFRRAFKAYAGVGFRGAALDEFHGMLFRLDDGQVLRERWYSPAMANAFQARFGASLMDTLFDMRYAPAGEPEVRIRAINRYFDCWRQGPLRIEQAFARMAREYFGPATFLGIHDTFHNALDNDEVWSTGINWWAIPRDYGQTDERNAMSTRLGVSLTSPSPIEFNQFYSKSRQAIYDETSRNLLYNARTHYHAWNDTRPWGVDIGDPQLLANITREEDKVRLLNLFDAPRPKLDLLVVFGYPRLLNWMPDNAARNKWDVNGALHAEETAAELWKNGFLCALLPSYAIDEGKITEDGKGNLQVGGSTFSHVLFLGTEFSKPETLAVLERFLKGGGHLMIDGLPLRNFDGTPVAQSDREILSHATIGTPNAASVASFGVPNRKLDSAAIYEDGSVVLSNMNSELTGTDAPLHLSLGGHRFEGAFRGMFAIKLDAKGHIEKLAAGHMSTLLEDGKPLVTVSPGSDLELKHAPDSGWHGQVVGPSVVHIAAEK